MRRQNVIFLTVDALRADRLSCGGYARPTTPNLDSMAHHAMYCEAAYTLSPSTAGAFPSLMTSSRPLSYGGFDRGAVGRPATMAAALGQAGWRTHMLSTVHWVNRFFGYGEGVDEEVSLFTLKALVGLGSALMKTTIERFVGGAIGEDERAALLTPVLTKWFDCVRQYCHECRVADALPVRRRNANFFADRYRWDRVEAVLDRHERAFKDNPRGYLRTHMSRQPRSHEWISSEWNLCRAPARLVEEAVFRIVTRILAPFAPIWSKGLANRYKQYIDAGDLVDLLLAKAAASNDERPFFLWTHFFDTHLPYCPGENGLWFRDSRRILSDLGYGGEIDPTITLRGKPTTDEGWRQWGAMYDAAISYVDAQIGRLVRGLKDMGRDQDTLVVVCGDHGEELGEHGDISHHFRLYEHNAKVPILFHHPGLAATRIDGLTTLMDIAPTIAEFCGVTADPGWEGAPVSSDEVASRDRVVLETFFGSPCDFANRPIYLGLRQGNMKLMVKEARDHTDKLSPPGPQLYDLERDPGEQHNLFAPNHPFAIHGAQVLAERLAELKDFSADRWPELLGIGSSFPAWSPDRAR